MYSGKIAVPPGGGGIRDYNIQRVSAKTFLTHASFIEN
jgi:hypothetical protein